MSELRYKRKQFYDFNLLLAVITLIVFGFVMIYSASSFSAQIEYNNSLHYTFRQMLFAGIGAVCMIFISLFVDYHILKVAILRNTMYFGTFLLLVYVLIFGDSGGGQKRWINLGPINMQPSEIAKFVLIVCCAYFIQKNYKNIDKLKVLGKLILTVVFMSAPILPTNMSTFIIVVLIPLAMHFTVSRNMKFYLFLLLVAIIVVYNAVPVATFLHHIKIVKEYQLDRVIVWKNPEADPTGGGFQVLQALYAIGSGGIQGKGLGAGMQKFLLPESQNDMIFSIICEELGILGGGGVILVFYILLHRCNMIASMAPDLFGSMLVTGVMWHIAIQLILNVSVALNLIPNTGVGLPFISYGGSSLVFLMIEIGFVLAVARKIPIEDDEEVSLKE